MLEFSWQSLFLVESWLFLKTGQTFEPAINQTILPRFFVRLICDLNVIRSLIFHKITWRRSVIICGEVLILWERKLGMFMCPFYPPFLRKKVGQKCQKRGYENKRSEAYPFEIFQEMHKLLMQIRFMRILLRNLY